MLRLDANEERCLNGPNVAEQYELCRAGMEEAKGAEETARKPEAKPTGPPVHKFRGCLKHVPEEEPASPPKQTWAARKEARGWSVRVDNQHGGAGHEIARLDTGFAGDVERNALFIAAAPETARQCDELAAELSALRKQRHLEQVAADLQKAKLRDAEKQRDELLAALTNLREEIDWITSQSDDQRLDALQRLHRDYHSILHAADTAIARCQPAEKGAA